MFAMDQSAGSSSTTTSSSSSSMMSILSPLASSKSSSSTSKSPKSSYKSSSVSSLKNPLTIISIGIAVVILLLMASSVPAVNAIHCWQCNSAQDKFCEDVPISPDQETLHDCYKKMYKECQDETQKLNYTFCRKQVQTIDKSVRIIRSCGFIRSQQDCYWTKNPPATTLVCQCDGDGCNAAISNQWKSNFLMMAILTSTAIILGRFLF